MKIKIIILLIIFNIISNINILYSMDNLKDLSGITKNIEKKLKENQDKIEKGISIINMIKKIYNSLKNFLTTIINNINSLISKLINSDDKSTLVFKYKQI